MNNKTDNIEYCKRLKTKGSKWWKTVLNVQAPYKWNLKRLKLGFVLDIGCGIGRNLINLNGCGVGVDHNPHSIEECTKLGLKAYTSENFKQSNYYKNNSFDSLLLSHLCEHLNLQENINLISEYLPNLKEDGKIVFITPQLAGFKSDSTHKWFVQKQEVKQICDALNLKIIKSYSFPFPKFFGKFFKYNENIVIAEKKNFKTLHSFAVLAYKESKYLESCIQSLINQKYKSNIYISTSTPSNFLDNIANKYGINVYVTNNQKGIANDWNHALKIADTKYVTLAHQDDIYEYNYSELCIKNAEKNNDTLITFTDYSELINNTITPSRLLLKIKKILMLPFLIFKNKKSLLLLGSPICCPSVMFNKALLNNFEFSKDFSINLDWDAWLRISELKGKFVFVNKKLMQHRVHAESETTIGLQNKKRQTEDIIMFEKIWGKTFGKLIAIFYRLSYLFN